MEVRKLVLLKRINPTIFEIHVNEINQYHNLLLETKDESFATRLVDGFNSHASQHQIVLPSEEQIDLYIKTAEWKVSMAEALKLYGEFIQRLNNNQ